MTTTTEIADGQSVLAQVRVLIEPFNTKGIELGAETTFAADLELDSLAVMDLLAAIEDHFDVSVPLNMLPDLDTIGKVADAVRDILEDG